MYVVPRSLQVPSSTGSVSQSAPTLRAVSRAVPEKHSAARRSAKALRPFQPALAYFPSLAAVRYSLPPTVEAHDVQRASSGTSSKEPARL